MGIMDEEKFPVHFIELGEHVSGRLGIPLEDAILRLLELRDRFPGGSFENAFSLGQSNSDPR